MKILLAMEPGGGGVGRHVIDLAFGLLQRGHHVELVYSPRRADAWLLEAIHSLPLTAHPVPMQREVSWRDAAAAFSLGTMLRKSGPFDVVHGHSSKAGALLRLVTSLGHSKRIYTPHAFVTLSPDLGRARRFIYATAERWLAALADTIICVSEEERQHALSLGIARDKLRVVNNGIRELAPVERSDVRKTMGIGPDELCVGFVGRLGAQKAADRLLTAFAAAGRQHGQLRLVIAGDGPDLLKLRRQAHALGIDNRVTFSGAANGAELMAGFDIFALPSRYEAFPYVYLEAAARGLPIITTRVGGSSEMVRDGFNGFVVSQDPSAEIAEKLSLLCSNSQLRLEMGQRSAELAGHFTMERMVGETIACYEQAQGSA